MFTPFRPCSVYFACINSLIFTATLSDGEAETQRSKIIIKVSQLLSGTGLKFRHSKVNALDHETLRFLSAAAAAAKSLQSCLTLWTP